MRPYKGTRRGAPAALGIYGNRNFSKHHFCRHRGIQVFARISRASESSVAVNLHCLPGIDTASLAPGVFDGARKL